MKKIIIAIVLMVLIPISYLGAEDKRTVDPVNDKTLMSLNGYLPLPAKYKYDFYKEGITKETEKADFLNCIEGQRRIVSFGRMSAGDEETKPHQGYHSTVWVTIQCMKDKGYVGKKPKLIEDPDYHEIYIREVKFRKSY
jgi:hypothetical protein